MKNAAFYFTAYRKLLKSYYDFQMNSLVDFELSPNEIVVLSSLENMFTASEIALSADVSKALVSRSVKLLLAKGFINTCPSALDKREQVLSLTDEGSRVVELIDEANRRFFATSFANFEDNEALVLKELLKIMMTNLKIEGFEW